MAETIVSPGVFTRENDLTFLAEGVSQIGAAVIGPTSKGPAFTPVTVTSQNEFTTKFGTNGYYTPYTVQNYLKSAGIVTIVRVLGVASYSLGLFQINNADTGDVFAVLAQSGSNTTGFASASVLGTVADFAMAFDAAAAISMSFDSRKSQYITNVLDGAVGRTAAAYVYLNFPTAQSQSIVAGGTATVSASAGGAVISQDTRAPQDVPFGSYNNASTPWVISQITDWAYSSSQNLFKFHTLGDGIAANAEVKVGIFDIKKADEVGGSDYGTFSVAVRVYSDTDSRPTVLETFTGCTLDPSSTNYVARVIGDRRAYYRTIGGESKLVYEGDYDNKSAYVRVEMTEDSIAKELVPYGFRAYSQPFNGACPTMSYAEQQIINGETNTRAYRGFDFTHDDSKSYLTTLPTTTNTGSNIDFHMDLLADLTSSVNTRGADGGRSDYPERKFMVAVQGGADGIDPRTSIVQGENISSTNTQGFDCSSATATGSLGYKKALDAIANPDEIDINLIVLPGILKRHHSYVSNYAINICESRGDCFYLMDNTGLTDSISTAVSEVTSLDTNYAACYYPWVKILDPNTNIPLWVPPSVVMAGVYSFNDKVGYEWFAPAGLNRGGITEAVEAYSRLTHTERDELYSGRVNPIASFPGQGVVAWGQKTLQAQASALDRVNVRRLLIALKKFIASSSRYLVFEQNVTATRNRFLNIVNPYLTSVQDRAGLYAFKVVMDDTNNTPDVIDRNQLYGQIYLQPTRTAEFIVLDFNILPTGATFPE